MVKYSESCHDSDSVLSMVLSLSQPEGLSIGRPDAVEVIDEEVGPRQGGEFAKRREHRPGKDVLGAVSCRVVGESSQLYG